VPATLATKLGVQGGVIITSLRPGSFADDINLEKGAIIVAINKKPVHDKTAYNNIVNNLKSGQDVAFEVRFTGADSTSGTSYVGGTLP